MINPMFYGGVICVLPVLPSRVVVLEGEGSSVMDRTACSPSALGKASSNHN